MFHMTRFDAYLVAVDTPATKVWVIRVHKSAPTCLVGVTYHQLAIFVRV
jgi:hypothetical protein